MNRVTKVASILGATALVMSVTACGSDGGDYCDELKNTESELSDADTALTDPGALSDMTEKLESVADSAPDEVKEDWTAVTDAFTTLSELDVDFNDPEAMSDPEVMEQLEGMADVQTNFENIATHAEEECDVDMGTL
ncbi:hypothetical protein [Haloactinopolyspora sp.]|uniref:hypothetical protein n=1 Tax=Haloactinopolyspora sp. TaxID=1966353 RepID=UPI002635D4D7|nr:hypothetical protein [Haloactinopolyspora sp.]